VKSSSADLICAVGAALFDAEGDGGNRNNNPLCGREIEVSTSGTTVFEEAHVTNGHSVKVTVADRCAKCAESDLYLSPSAFSQLASETKGK